MLRHILYLRFAASTQGLLEVRLDGLSLVFVVVFFGHFSSVFFFLCLSSVFVVPSFVGCQEESLKSEMKYQKL